MLPSTWDSKLGSPLPLPARAMDPGTPGHPRQLPGPLLGGRLWVVDGLVSRSCVQTQTGDAPPDCLSGVSLNQPVQVGAGFAIGACAGLWSLGILLFVILFLTNRGRRATLGGRVDQPGSYPEPQPPWPGHSGGTKDQATGPGLQRGLSPKL